MVTLEEGAELAENLAPNLPEDARTSVQQDIRRNREAARQIRCLIEGLNSRRDSIIGVDRRFLVTNEIGRDDLIAADEHR